MCDNDNDDDDDACQNYSYRFFYSWFTLTKKYTKQPTKQPHRSQCFNLKCKTIFGVIFSANTRDETTCLFVHSKSTLISSNNNKSDVIAVFDCWQRQIRNRLAAETVNNVNEFHNIGGAKLRTMGKILNTKVCII